MPCESGQRTFSLFATLGCSGGPAGGGVPVAEANPAYLSPLAMVADPQGKLLYIAEFTARQIAVFETASERVRRTIPLPDRPSGLALSRRWDPPVCDGRRGGWQGVRRRYARGHGRDTLAAGHTPIAPVLSRDGNTLFVCNRFNNKVSVHDLKTKSVTARIPVRREPVAAACRPTARGCLWRINCPPGRPTAGTWRRRFP